MKTNKLLKLNINIVHPNLSLAQPVVIGKSEMINIHAAQENINMIDNFSIQDKLIKDLVSQGR